MENRENNEEDINNAYIQCRASDITKLLKTPTDRRNIARELSKLLI